MIRYLRQLKMMLTDISVIRSTKVFNKDRIFLFRVFKKEYECYKKWIEPAKPSQLPIDILIPVIAKDIRMLPHVINSARKHIKHPIQNIYIIAPAEENIMACAAKLGCVFINEKDVCAIDKKEINFLIDGYNRSGWIYQQLLKLNINKTGTCEHVLALDADTIFIRDIVFEKDGKLYFDFSDEYHLPYYTAYELVTGLKHRSKVSFVSHYMLFSKHKLAKLRQHIEQHTGQSLEDAVIDLKNTVKEVSNFSEFETYANYCLQNAPGEYRTRYWFNKVFEGNDVAEISNVKADANTRSISAHVYQQSESK